MKKIYLLLFFLLVNFKCNFFEKHWKKLLFSGLIGTSLIYYKRNKILKFFNNKNEENQNKEQDKNQELQVLKENLQFNENENKQIIEYQKLFKIFKDDVFAANIGNFKKIFEELNINNKLNNIIFEGAPGTGKTLMAYLIAKDKYFIKITEHFLKNNNLKFILEAAKKLSKEKTVIILFDEADSFLGENFNEYNKIKLNNLKDLITYLNDKKNNKNDIKLIYTTNHIDLVNNFIKKESDKLKIYNFENLKEKIEKEDAIKCFIYGKYKKIIEDCLTKESKEFFEDCCKKNEIPKILNFEYEKIFNFNKLKNEIFNFHSYLNDYTNNKSISFAQIEFIFINEFIHQNSCISCIDNRTDIQKKRYLQYIYNNNMHPQYNPEKDEPPYCNCSFFEKPNPNNNKQDLYYKYTYLKQKKYPEIKNIKIFNKDYDQLINEIDNLLSKNKKKLNGVNEILSISKLTDFEKNIDINIDINNNEINKIFDKDLLLRIDNLINYYMFLFNNKKLINKNIFVYFLNLMFEKGILFKNIFNEKNKQNIEANKENFLKLINYIKNNINIKLNKKFELLYINESKIDQLIENGQSIDYFFDFIENAKDDTIIYFEETEKYFTQRNEKTLESNLNLMNTFLVKLDEFKNKNKNNKDLILFLNLNDTSYSYSDSDAALPRRFSIVFNKTEL